MPTDIQQTFLHGRFAFHVLRYKFYVTRQTLFEISWRLAIIALPWQTRLFMPVELGGWNWEQGSAAVYVSWVLMALVVTLGFWQKRKPIPPLSVLKISGAMLFLVVISIIGTGFEGRSLIAVAEWWLQVALLLFFALSLFQAGVKLRSLAFWFVISLLPHVALGLEQYATQTVTANKWLGIAAQLPENPGVSVVEHGLFRVLRMYGGFPHPNIFGGWMALGLVASLWLTATAETKWRALLHTVFACLLSVAVLLSYARSAWLAAVVGILVLFVGQIRPIGRMSHEQATIETTSFQFFLIALLASILVAGVVAVPQADHLATRFNPSARLEAKSLQTRVSSLRLGWEIFKKHPWFGTGPNAELVGLVSPGQKLPAPLEPPHNAFVLAIINFGIVGTSLLIYLLYQGRKHILGLLRAHALAAPIFFGVVVLGLLDHYLWSYWPGQVLFGMSCLMICLDIKPKNL